MRSEDCTITTKGVYTCTSLVYKPLLLLSVVVTGACAMIQVSSMECDVISGRSMEELLDQSQINLHTSIRDVNLSLATFTGNNNYIHVRTLVHTIQFSYMQYNN